LYGALKGGSPLPEDHAKTLINMLHLNGLAKTPEGVALWLVVQSNYPGIQLPKHVWHHGNPLHRKEKVSLARVLRETTPKDDTKDSVQRGNWVPKLHFAWEVVFEALPMTRSEKTNFADLWAEVVDSEFSK
jgi:DNA polymerase phi